MNLVVGWVTGRWNIPCSFELHFLFVLDCGLNQFGSRRRDSKGVSAGWKIERCFRRVSSEAWFTSSSLAILCKFVCLANWWSGWKV